ncbi:40S ribosomal protein S27 [Raphanus sativus]|nr:40S ribosomal protein S27 [Raphanus sativus]
MGWAYRAYRLSHGHYIFSPRKFIVPEQPHFRGDFSSSRVSPSRRLSSHFLNATMVLQNDIDLLNPPAELEKRKHKLKRLVQSPNSFFMDVKCQGCFNITTVFSHSQTVVVCGNCQTVLCQPTGGKARLTEGCSFRKK